MKNRISVEGEGIPVVLVHGMGGPKIWTPIVETLKKHYQVIIPTFPGFLKEDTNFIYTDDLYVNFLCELRKSLDIDKWNVVGISMGGRTALNYSIKEKEQVNSLTLIDSIGVGYMSPLLRVPLLKYVFPGIIKKVLNSEKNRNNLAKNDFVNKDGEECLQCVSWFNDLVEDNIVRSNFANILSKVGIPKKEWNTKLKILDLPTQILWATNDNTAPIKWANWLKSRIHGSELHVIEKYKHMAILEKPDFFSKLILDFIKKTNL